MSDKEPILTGYRGSHSSGHIVFILISPDTFKIMGEPGLYSFKQLRHVLSTLGAHPVPIYR